MVDDSVGYGKAAVGVSGEGRPSWDEYYSGIARAVSQRGECVRRQVGAVIVKNHTIIATGYNGAPAGEPSCLDGACPRAFSDAKPGEGYAQSGCKAIHAETNAIIRAGRDRCLGATMYITTDPCELCRPLIAAAGISRVVAGDAEPWNVPANSSVPGNDNVSPVSDVPLRGGCCGGGCCSEE